MKTLTDRLLSRITPPRHLPRLALEDGVPAEGRTLCVTSVLLTDEAAAREAMSLIRSVPALTANRVVCAAMSASSPGRPRMMWVTT